MHASLAAVPCSVLLRDTESLALFSNVPRTVYIVITRAYVNPEFFLHENAGLLFCVLHFKFCTVARQQFLTHVLCLQLGHAGETVTLRP